ncbi:CheR family methyltransferase [Massilia sp. 2TAF26]|uniref:CheR family methyltransferase n=1 Tax=Massilia sp. 2TAF26 TaxID=3233012 RepID=UPI003F9D8451
MTKRGAHIPMDVALDLAARRIEAETGLHFPPTQRRQLSAALERMAVAQGYARQADCLAWLLAGTWNAEKTALCARFLTVGETYFFREPRALDLLCDYAREHIARGAKPPLRVWSAGCCTGEEPYSIAMTLQDRVPQMDPDMVAILATDLNPVFLDFARAGIYRPWSFRRTEPQRQAAHFSALDDGRFRISPGLRARVKFAQLNLASDGFPDAAAGTSGIDLIFCRNVLMYFARPLAKQVIARLRACLVDGGWLVVNPSEASAELFEGFAPVYFADAVFFRKQNHAHRAPPARAEAPAAVAVKPVPARAASAAPAAAPQLVSAHDEMAARASLLVRHGEPGAALQLMRRAIEAAPLSTPLYQTAAALALEHGASALARQWVKGLLYLEPQSAYGHYLAALVEHADGRSDAVAPLLRTCQALLPAEPDADGLHDAVASLLGRVQ